MLVSFDVTSLFTQVPINETIDVIRNKHQVEDHLINLIQHCDKHLLHIQRPEGPPLLIIGNIFMEDFETRALDTAKYKPKLWLRYVDDTFIIWTHGEDKLQNFLSHLNGIHPKIKFTFQVDVFVIKKQDGTLGHTVF
ncbi:hypothetical protein Trydic_g14454 [Trypoxylus dichotomus]